jgi:uncharacterized membrane protein YqjE
MADMNRSTAAAMAPQRESETPMVSNDIETLPSLFGRLGDDVVKLLDTKLSLAKIEIKEDATAFARQAAMIGLGAVVAAVGFALLNVALAFFVSSLFEFSEPVNYALGFIISGVVYLAIGGALIVMMKNRIASHQFVPERTVDELRKDKQWLKKEI